MKAKKKVLLKFKGISDVTAAAMLALIPELGYIKNREVSSLVGLAPMDRDSGIFKGKRTISGGRAHARKALYMPAWVAVLLIRANAALRNHIDTEEKIS